jgi:hypothetical protein
MGHGWHETAAVAESRPAVTSTVEWGAVARLWHCASAWTLGARATVRRAWRWRFSQSPRQLLEVHGH